MITMKKNFNIVLCGFMGCGKTTVGHRLAALTGRTFIDTDLHLEKKLGLSVSKIFSMHGEIYFRELEKKHVAEVSQYSNCIISTGGGTVLNKENVLALKRNGKIFFLDAAFDKIFSRISTSNRPLVKALSKNELKNLFESRQEFYIADADVIVNANQTCDTICADILDSISTKL